MPKPNDLLDNEENAQPEGQDELSIGDVLKDFKRAFKAKERFLDAAKEDFEFFLGKQWDDDDLEKLEKVGVRGLTINKIAPHIQLLKGIESQNRSDFRVFAEGDEDALPAEIGTRLMKNAIKNSEFEYENSEAFEDGNVCGESFLEPWIHYPYKARKDGTVDMTGQLCWRKNYFDQMFPDPAARKYDYSDGKFFCKFTSDLSMNQLIELFPNKKEEIEKMKGGKISIDAIGVDKNQAGIDIQRRDYKDKDMSADPWLPTNAFDLIDYYYQKYVPKYYVADFTLKQVRLAKNKKEADRYVKQVLRRDEKEALNSGKKLPKVPTAKVIERLQPEMWVAFVTGGDIENFLSHGPAWSFPRWDSYPFFGYSCFKSSAPLDSKHREYFVQGITRRVKDQNRELNKRRTQELRHLNQSANSGWIGEETAFVDEPKWEQFGSAPGVILKHKEGTQLPTKIIPTPLSQGHAQMAQEHQQDMRDAIGVNPETLAIEADQSSGRAIALRQKQGMVLVQGQFDNLARTRRRIGRFVLAMLPEIFDVEKAMKVLGQAFLNENFQRPVVDPATGQPVIDPNTGQPLTQYDQQAAIDTINKVLNDAELGTFDVSVGENISTETIAMANYMQLMDMASKGLPIPPDVIVEESTLSESQKKKIIAAFQAQAQQSAKAPPKPKK